MVLACMVNIFGAVTTVFLTKGWTFGIPPILFLAFTTTVTDVLFSAFTLLPGMVLFAKLIPDAVESSMFALLTGVSNFANLYLAQENGVFVNSFFNVTKENLDQLWILFSI